MSQSGPFPERPVAGAHVVFFGGTAGIGHAASVELGRRGANILLVGRDPAAGERAASRVRAAGAASADFLSGDLSTVRGTADVADSVRAWAPSLHGVMHTAMTAFKGRQLTTDGLEFAFALQYQARAMLNRLLVDRLAASGDGRIVHVAGNVPNLFMPDLDDLHYERRRWSFLRSLLGTHLLGFLHIQEAARRWRDLPVTIAAACVGSTRTKTMADPRMPPMMRLMGRFGTTPETSAANPVRLLLDADIARANGAILRSPKRFDPVAPALPDDLAERLWAETARLAQRGGVALP